MFGNNSVPDLSEGGEIVKVDVDLHPGTDEPQFSFSSEDDEVEEIDFSQGGVVIRFSSDRETKWVPVHRICQVEIKEGMDTGGFL